MTISILLMILTFAGPGSGQSIGNSSQTSYAPPIRKKIIGHCYINGVWYNPCPSDEPGPAPDPHPENQE
jgi:hypothetical protein